VAERNRLFYDSRPGSRLESHGGQEGEMIRTLSLSRLSRRGGAEGHGEASHRMRRASGARVSGPTTAVRSLIHTSSYLGRVRCCGLRALWAEPRASASPSDRCGHVSRGHGSCACLCHLTSTIYPSRALSLLSLPSVKCPASVHEVIRVRLGPWLGWDLLRSSGQSPGPDKYAFAHGACASGAREPRCPQGSNPRRSTSTSAHETVSIRAVISILPRGGEHL
jgi:hypothetical protein